MFSSPATYHRWRADVHGTVPTACAVAYADLLGRAMAASVLDPFVARFAPEFEFAADYALYEALGRARAALGAWEEDPAAAEARWRDLLDG